MAEQNVQNITFNKQLIAFERFYHLSKKDIAYQSAHPKLRPFFKYEVNIEAFAKLIKDKTLQPGNRALLHEVLLKQYKAFAISKKTAANIDLIKSDDTFTLVTAHQPSLFTGPLYYIYKICSVINLSRQLKREYPSYNFVPVFISGAEDHDFEEISSAKVFGKKLQWNNVEGGSVGALSTSSLKTVSEELFEMIGDSDEALKLKKIFGESYAKFENYGTAVQHIVHELFKEFGLVVLDMSDAQLKKSFIPIIKKEILEQRSFPLVKDTVQKLEQAGFGGQAHTRNINFFYLGKGFRKRIEKDGDGFKVVDSDISFSKAEMIAEIEAHPEKFSPNVVMRPLYQEYVLPNLAYIGGGGELAYWLERKSQFEYFEVNFPMLIRRNSVLWIDKGSSQKILKLGTSIEELLKHPHDLVKSFLTKNAEGDISLEEEKKAIEALYKGIKEKSVLVDKSLEAKVAADLANHIKAMDKLEQRLKKAAKSKHEVSLRQVSKLQEKLFPSESLQERKENFIPMYLKHGDAFFEYLVEELDPLLKEFIIIKVAP